ncbi:hypothetical protein ASE07_24865 [Noviherbaspirillum sp. Root189]|nr:hypothetical protein ASE07_24865 [Noviherbaspirillum sp. Root189]
MPSTRAITICGYPRIACTGRAPHRNGLEKFRVLFIIELVQFVPGAKNSLADTAQHDHADACF